MKFIKDISLENKRVLIRVDYNVPISGAEILNDFRIKQSLPSINHCLDQNAAIILMSHLGRPKGIRSEACSLETVCWHLEDLLEKSIMFAEDCISETMKFLIIASNIFASAFDPVSWFHDNSFLPLES